MIEREFRVKNEAKKRADIIIFMNHPVVKRHKEKERYKRKEKTKLCTLYDIDFFRK